MEHQKPIKLVLTLGGYLFETQPIVDAKEQEIARMAVGSFLNL